MHQEFERGLVFWLLDTLWGLSFGSFGTELLLSTTLFGDFFEKYLYLSGAEFSQLCQACDLSCDWGGKLCWSRDCAIVVYL